ncbi:MAG: Gfo/Idh/MocA family oxidoreductase [Ruminococcaceae bacterium]|nr:Gfo/Idh/MocA family oxidoreductase [Oscillospiraceae bacterium]
MEKLRVGIIGCGGIANGKHMPALKGQAVLAEMVAFCDIIPERAEKAAKEFGVPDAKVYTDYKELLKDETIDVVHVCTPNRSHCEITVAALEADKHVMCEKPMAKTVEDAEKMLDAAKRTGKKLTIGYQNRFRPDSLLLKSIVEKGDLGDIYAAKANAIRRRAVPTWGVFLNEYEQGGGPLIDIGTHALDLTLWTMNNYKPKMVVGQTFHKLADQKNTGNIWGDWDCEQFTVEDSAFGFIRMENGAIIELESSWALNTRRVEEATTTLCGTKAGADMHGGLWINRVEWGKMVEIKPDLAAGGVDFYDGDANGSPADIECHQWLKAVINDTDPVVLPEQALTVTRILEAIYTSAKTGEPVFFD